MELVKFIIKHALICYQKIVSPFLPKTCRFYPTCSEYALRALEKKSLGEALMLTIKRILRCHPFDPGGYDPVPGNEINKRIVSKGDAW
ncbi:MAG: membrane protein insertion efficiency factor YidD [Candidatus Syntrophonatronum acetioxidans]|uniref:Putative membrane protein insertion efficiency factor n=1 Tax=Candidatus Syntrophonatronum acetioxidans TaxID=1795816 RepID=A0A424YB08_9FIRM|nr:MAG: membrane protein insertion efficiency factor YidD [Candidatus Syntrophonatronum acetioxidans]